MDIKKTVFNGSWEKAEDIKHDGLPEFAFIGRSNVGKSSLINMLCNHKGLAKTSAQPGKTQTLNLFTSDNKFQICDLPGYGYAKVSKLRRHVFSKMIEHYLQKRPNLVSLFVLVDLRIAPQAIDIAFINWCGENNIPFVIVGTKADKLSPLKISQQIENYGVALSEVWEELPTFFASSAETKMGRKEILDYMKKCFS